jgi:hypothetical protein
MESVTAHNFGCKKFSVLKVLKDCHRELDHGLHLVVFVTQIGNEFTEFFAVIICWAACLVEFFGL